MTWLRKQEIESGIRSLVDAGLSDEALIEAISAGDREALGQLYDRYARLSLAVAYRVLGEHGAAEDAVQDAYLSVWRRAHTFDPTRGAARAWLLTIVRNGAIDRRRGRAGRALLDTPLDDVAYRLATAGEETFAAVAAAVEADRVLAVMRALPEEQRQAIELAYFGGLTQQEIAERTQSPLGTVKGRIRLGLHKMRDGLIDLAPTSGGSDEAPQTVEPTRSVVNRDSQQQTSRLDLARAVSDVCQKVSRFRLPNLIRTFVPLRIGTQVLPI